MSVSSVAFFSSWDPLLHQQPVSSQQSRKDVRCRLIVVIEQRAVAYAIQLQQRLKSVIFTCRTAQHALFNTVPTEHVLHK